MKFLTAFCAVTILALGSLSAKESATPSALDTVINEYLAATEALVADDFAKAKPKLDAMIASIAENESAFPKSLMPLAKAVDDATDLDSARKAFKPFSASLISILVADEKKTEKTLHIAYCPMAEGSWLQTNKEEIENPYFGQQMLRCGSIQKSIGETPPAAAE